MAAAIMEKIMPVMKDAGITDFGEVYLYVSCMLIIMVIFVLISALVILATCEFYIVANIGVLLIGLGGSKIFKDYAVNVMRYVLSVAIKLFVLQLVVNIGFAVISLSDLDASVGATVKSIKFVDLFFLIGKSIILLALAKTLPDTCAGMISGSAIGGGNPLASMAKTAGIMAFGAATASAGYAAGAASAVNDSHTVARGQGVTGVAGTAGGMARAMWNARSDAKAGQAQKEFDQNPGSLRNQLRSAAGAAKAKKLLEAGGSGETAQEPSSANQARPRLMAADGYEQPETEATDSVS
jgi:type IV secretion system protein TrbL